MKYPDDFINKIIQGDCLDFMKLMPDKCVDLVLTDPPYGIGDFQKTGDANNYKLRKELEYDDDLSWNQDVPNEDVFKEIYRVSKNQIIFGANYLNCFNSLGGAIVWDKNNESSQRYSNCEIASCSLQKKVSIFRYTWNGMIQQDMKNKEVRHHPTQKPVELFKWILLNYSQENDIILDCYLGSGTTAVACQNLKRNFIGIEISPKYCETARQRLRQQTLL